MKSIASIATLVVLLLGTIAEARPRRTSLQAKHSAAAPRRARLCYPKAPQQLHSSFRPPAAGQKVRVAFFDADSTLRVATTGAPCPNKASEVALLPMTGPKIASLVKRGYLVAVVSNQGGIEKGFMSKEQASGALRRTCKLVAKQPGCAIHYYDFAPAYDNFRKPGTGMGDHLAKVVKQKCGREIDWEHSIMVGDSGYKRKVDLDPKGKPGTDFSNSDRRFAEALRAKYGCSAKGMAYHHPRDYFGWAKKGVRNFHGIKDLARFLKANPAKAAGPTVGSR